MLTLSKTDHSRPKAFFANSSAIIEPYPIKKELKVLNGNKPWVMSFRLFLKNDTLTLSQHLLMLISSVVSGFINYSIMMVLLIGIKLTLLQKVFIKPETVSSVVIPLVHYFLLKMVVLSRILLHIEVFLLLVWIFSLLSTSYAYASLASYYFMSSRFLYSINLLYQIFTFWPSVGRYYD